ncbi:MAG: O-antigen ligase family protein [Lachnospiraceae bacterium]|nr:O-antigen ligase family protein [Lachnospiraceae bacterium]
MMEAVTYNKLISDKRRRMGNLSLFLGVFILTTLYFHFFSWYSLTAPYGTLIAAVFLIISLFCYVDIKYMLKDPAFYLMAFGDLIALIHLFAIGSNKGAILTIFDFLLILYLANKVCFNEKETLISAGYTAFFFLYWTVDVKGYFKGYNTNYGGLVLITGFCFLIFLLEYIFSKMKKGKAYIALRLIEVFLFALAFNIISWYRSRCALVGLITFSFIYLLPKKLWRNKIIYGMLCLLGTLGSVVFSAFYVWLGRMKEVFSLRIFYKDIISGREEIWAELWEEYLKKPFTGIGSSYVMKLEWMEGLFEVHSGLLDILIVHGLVVFLIVLCFILKRLFSLRETVSRDVAAKTAMAGIFGMLFTAFMENYIIVAPFSLMFLMLFAYVNHRGALLEEGTMEEKEFKEEKALEEGAKEKPLGEKEPLEEKAKDSSEEKV